MIEIENLDVIFQKDTSVQTHALKKINLNISEGEFVIVIGGNGAGKSTLMNTIFSQNAQYKGSIKIDGLNIKQMSLSSRSKCITKVFQNPLSGTFSDLTIEENLALAASRGDAKGLNFAINAELRAKFADSLKELGIGLEKRLTDKVSSLSGGQRQAMSLIMATSFHKPKLLLLDEHTSALDQKISDKIMNITNKVIRSNNICCLMITHSFNQALNFGDRILVMKKGQIFKNINKKRVKLDIAKLREFID